MMMELRTLTWVKLHFVPINCAIHDWSDILTNHEEGMQENVVQQESLGSWNIWKILVVTTVIHGCLESILLLQRACESPERHFEFLGIKEASILMQLFVVW